MGANGVNTGGACYTGVMAVLSKTRFISGCQCALRLWLETWRPELAAAPDARTRARFERGTQIGIHARERYPGGRLIGATQNEAARRATDEALADAFVPAIYEGGFIHQDVVVRADILARAGLGEWDLLEVKSGSEVREVFVLDLALQYWVLSGAGVRLRSAGLLLPAAGVGEEEAERDPQGAFEVHELSAECERRAPEIGERVRFSHDVLSQKSPPEVPMGEHCHKPYACPFLLYCGRHR